MSGEGRRRLHPNEQRQRADEPTKLDGEQLEVRSSRPLGPVVEGALALALWATTVKLLDLNEDPGWKLVLSLVAWTVFWKLAEWSR